MRWLDDLIREALRGAAALHSQTSGADPFRGLHISQEDVERLLAQQPGQSLLTDRNLSDRIGGIPLPAGISRIAEAFKLDAFDLAVMVIAAGPDLDLRYERFYAFLQDDVNRKRATVDLILNLLCGDLDEKVRRRAHFAADSPLVQNRLVHLAGDAPHTVTPLLAQFVSLDEQVIAALLGERSMDRRLAGSSRLVSPGKTADTKPISIEIPSNLRRIVRRYRSSHEPVRLYLQNAGGGLDPAALAHALQQPLLHVDLARLLDSSTDFDSGLLVAVREGWLKDAVLHVTNYDVLRSPEHALPHRQFLRRLADVPHLIVVEGRQPWVPQEGAPTVIPIAVAASDSARSAAYWRQALERRGLVADAAVTKFLAERFQLDAGQISNAVASASFGAPSPVRRDGRVSSDDLFAAARRQTRHALAGLAVRIEPSRSWDDLVLPADAVAQLHEICAHVVHRRQVIDTWGFGGKLATGGGTNVLFAGPSGTGKTLAAEVIAHELQIDLYRIDLASVVSKYIGETEKNLDKIFAAAESANAILFFDEADALFGKRSEVRDSHDRYANLEISYLLQRMEQHHGLAILATNLRQNLDDAFTRRLAFIVQFPFPDEEHRRRIWSGVWPASTPLGEDVDLGMLARQIKLSGGNIRNIALAAAFLAASDGQVVTRAHVLHASQREFQKLGKAFTDVGDDRAR